MAMSWHDLAFLHWPVQPKVLRPLIPEALEIDTFDGQAWIGIVPFHMTGVRPRWMPNLPGLSRFAELNVRTYVTADDKAGVWFHSLDAANAIAVWVARRTYYLSYYRARIAHREVDGWFHYESMRTHRGGGEARLVARYRPTGDVYQSEANSLDRWLTARYCLYTADRRGRTWRGEIDHAPWSLQRAEAEVETNTMTAPLGITLPDRPPLVHFSRRIDAVAWTLEAV
jgi:uncharacterized protein YqjF (DUF2071 family)